MVKTTKSSSVYKHCFFDIAKQQEYMNKWIVDHVWLDLIKQKYNVPTDIDINEQKLNFLQALFFGGCKTEGISQQMDGRQCLA